MERTLVGSARCANRSVLTLHQLITNKREKMSCHQTWATHWIFSRVFDSSYRYRETRHRVVICLDRPDLIAVAKDHARHLTWLPVVVFDDNQDGVDRVAPTVFIEEDKDIFIQVRVDVQTLEHLSELYPTGRPYEIWRSGVLVVPID